MLEHDELNIGTTASQVLAGVLILSGGLSTRMGSPKALLELPSGSTLLDYHLKHADKLNVPILVADNQQGFVDTVDITSNPILLIEDYKPQNSNIKAIHKHSAGPLGAIVSALNTILNINSLNKHPNKWLMVISCDSLLNAVDVWSLLNPIFADKNNHVAASANSAKVLALSDDERLYPLLALYELDLYVPLQRYLDAGKRRVMSFINPVMHSVNIPAKWGELSNLNTMDDFNRACNIVF